MRINHKLDYLFGPSGTFAGFTILAVGALSLISNIGLVGSIILIIIGAFVALTRSGTIIDTRLSRIKSYTQLFGVFRYGDWHPIGTFSSIGIKKSIRRQRTYSRSNRQLITSQEDYRIILVGKDPTLKIPVVKCKTRESAEAELENLRDQLNLEINES